MKKLIFLLAVLTSSLSFGLVTLDEVTSPADLDENLMLTDAQGNTFVIWSDHPHDNTNNNLIKVAYKPVNGSFGAATVVGEVPYGSQDPAIDAAIDSSGNLVVLWTDTYFVTTNKFVYRPAGDTSSFTDPEVAFVSSIDNYGRKIKSAPNGTFFIVFSTDGGLFWSERPAGTTTSFSSPLEIDESALNGNTTFDFDFDPGSNLLLSWIESDNAATAESDILFSFKPKNSGFQPLQRTRRISTSYYTDNVSVNYNCATSLGRTWSIFWEESSTRTTKGTFVFRGQLLKNKANNSDVDVASVANEVYSVTDLITDQFRVYQLCDNQVLAVWGENTTTLYFAVYNLNNLQIPMCKKLFNAQVIAQAGINPVLISVAINNGFPLLAWNTRGGQGGDIRWGYITNGTFKYEGSLQSVNSGVKPFSIRATIGFAKLVPIISWLGSTDPNSYIKNTLQVMMPPYKKGSRLNDATSKTNTHAQKSFVQS